MSLDSDIQRDLPPNHSFIDAGNARLRFEAGKGSRPRNNASQQFRRNYDAIQWRTSQEFKQSPWIGLVKGKKLTK